MLLTSALAVLFSANVISQMLDDEYTTLVKKRRTANVVCIHIILKTRR